MDDEIEKVVEEKSLWTCPSLTKFLVYCSVVVVLAAMIIPLELNFGIMRLYMKLDLDVPQDVPVHHYILHKLGYLSVKQDNDIKTTGIKEEKVFTKEELKMYSGDSSLIYLAILGKVFDVTKGRRHYGKGGTYSFFAGIDASRAYVTGKFKEEGLTDNIEGITSQNYLGLLNWYKFFQKDYVYIGKVAGYYYDVHGKPLDGLKIFEEGLVEGTKAKLKEDEDKILFPDCNSEWTPETGSIVWCAQQSGGVTRDWMGYPRMFYQPGERNHRCACIKKESFSDPRFKEYENCPSAERSCKLT